MRSRISADNLTAPARFCNSHLRARAHEAAPLTHSRAPPPPGQKKYKFDH
jgi:hypothetical protein